jgi:hypothetical protein
VAETSSSSCSSSSSFSSLSSSSPSSSPKPLPPFRHLLLVFGGVGGLEECLVCDEHIQATW